ncbi:MAG: hypothetical protein B6D55_00205 [Candidatus Omnitrophica bacterium 4484_70.2]|nr:MAG: hypothetical protein B6D55_00205 [Candidatus Omnitrophica bacterium 4484_70.2]
MKVPYHVAIIMDGNGRWAKRRGLPRNLGHKRGIERIEEVIKEAKKIGIKILTLFAFSTENWSRPKKEVNFLFSYLKRFLKKKKKSLLQEKIRVNFIGRRDRLDKELLEEMKNIEKLTRKNDALIINLAIDYGGRWDILNAAKRIWKEAKRKKINLEKIEEEEFRKYLALEEFPYPDLLIRTSGEKRISNFLLWQSAYTEFYFPEVLWPDFDKKELEKAVEEYRRRERRFGGLKSG